MLRKLLLVTLPVTLWLSMIGTEVTFAQQPEVRPVETPSVQNAHAIRAKQVLGGKVSIEGNMAIGRVDDIVFDQDGYIEYLIVENEGKLVTVPWDAAKFNFVERTAYINITPDQYKKVPSYTAEAYPMYTTPAYRTETYRYYNLTPRERRLERRLNRQP